MDGLETASHVLGIDDKADIIVELPDLPSNLVSREVIMNGPAAAFECKIIVNDNHAAFVDLWKEVLKADHRRVVPISVQPQDRDAILRFKSGKRLLKPSPDYAASAGACALHYTPTKFDVS